MHSPTQPRAAHKSEPARAHHIASIVRPPHAAHWELQRDPTALWFWRAAWDWMRGRAALRPLCLTCDHEFNDRVAAPLAFFCVAINISKDGWPQQVILTGVCEECAVKSDDELMKVGVAGINQRWPLVFGGTSHDVSEDGSGSVN